MLLKLATLQACIILVVEASQLWEEWWAYEGVSGPDQWGSYNRAWALCSKGKFQSPIDVKPESLIYDPNLKHIVYDSSLVDGTLMSTGHDITFLVANGAKKQFRFSGGPLSYSYAVHSIKLHIGIDNGQGSEHTIAGRQFPIEIQIMGYNTDLYRNFTEAVLSTHGLAILSVLGVIDEAGSKAFDILAEAVAVIRTKGLSKYLPSFSISSLLPPSDLYITYEGSITQPSCQETVTWLIINKPLHITKEQIKALRSLNSWTEDDPVSYTPLMENNFRRPKPLNRRPVRTNISPYKENKECAVKLNRSYKVNERLIGV